MMPGESGVNISGARSDDFIWISSISQQKLTKQCNFLNGLHVILVQAQDDSGGRLQGVQTPNRDTLSTPPPFVLSHPHRSSSDDRFPLSFRYDFAAKTHR
jgi:hypothetical protein